MFNVSDIVFMGIIFDFIAALFFTKNIWENSIDDIVKIAATLYGPNYYRIRDAINLWYDTRFGIAFFILGFVFQGFSFFSDVQITKANHLIDIVVGLFFGLVVFCIVLKVERIAGIKTIKFHYGSHIKNEISRNLGKEGSGTERLFSSYGKTLGIKRENNESLKSYGERLVGQLS